MIIAVDFDGTIHSGNYPAIGYIRPDVKEVLQNLRKEGHYIIIWTCRTGDDLLVAINWLLENKIEFDKINDNHPDNIKTYAGNTRKVYADVYVDDKQVGFLPRWREIEDYINKISSNQAVMI